MKIVFDDPGLAWFDAGIEVYSARFTISVDGEQYTGEAVRNVRSGDIDIDWDTPPSDVDYLEAIIYAAYDHSVGIEVVCRDVDVAAVLEEVGKDFDVGEVGISCRLEGVLRNAGR